MSGDGPRCQHAGEYVRKNAPLRARGGHVSKELDDIILWLIWAPLIVRVIWGVLASFWASTSRK